MKNKTQTKEEPRRNVNIPVTCMTCKHSLLHRYDSNPILAACQCKPQPGNEQFPFEIEIASLLRKCVSYDEAKGTKEVEQRYKHHVA